MFKNRDKMYQVYHTILSMALAWALTIAINEYYVLKVHVLAAAAFTLITAALVYLFDINRKNALAYLILFSIIPVAGLVFWIRGVNPLSWISDLGHWIWIYDYSEELYAVSHAYFLVLGISIAGVLLFYPLMKHEIIKTVLAAVLLGTLVLLSVRHVNLHKIVVGVCIFYLLSILVELAGRLYGRNSGKPEKKGGILYLAPVCLLLAVLSVWMPSKPEPIQWKGVKFLYNNLKDKVDNLITEWEFFRSRGQDEFALALTGYDGEGSLSGGSLKQNNKIALEVSGYSGDAPVYFLGSVSDIYTGNSWEKSRQELVPEWQDYLLDYYELVFAMSRVNPSVFEDNRFAVRRILRIEYQNIKTKTFFYPLKSSWYEIYSNTKSPEDDSANITFPKSVKGGTDYQTISYELNLKDEDFHQILREADQFSYQTGELGLVRMDWAEKNIFTHSSAPKAYTRDLLYEGLAARAEKIKEYYTALPEGLPERVKKLAAEITADEKTTYDKLKAIETYLREHYTYSTEPGPLPKGEDFVDYFLFENKRGYCTSFATSMAVLARCVGIPTRYAEGFLMDHGDKVNSKFLIRNSKAHSWAEAYFEGVGWIPFESTPPFYDYRYVQWKEYKKVEDTTEYNFQREEEPQIDPSQFITEPVTIKKTNKVSNTLIGGIILVSMTFTMLLLLVIYDIVLRIKYRNALKRADHSRKMYLLFLRILALLKKEGFTLGTEDTILTLADRIKDFFRFEKYQFRDIAEVFMRYRYAEAEITESELRKVEVFYQGLYNKHREEAGGLRMHIEEFFFLTRKGSRS